MLIDNCRLLAYTLPLRRAWQTNRGVVQQRQGWIVELTTDTGLLGHGDCAPLPAAGTETAISAETWLRGQLGQLKILSPPEALNRLPIAADTPAARFALETALLDLISQSKQMSLRQWLSPSAFDEIAVNGAGGTLDEQVNERIERQISKGFQVIKLKLGMFEIDQEIDQLRKLIACLPESVSLRLDANGAWSMEQARQFLDCLSECRVESLEEPLTKPDLDKLSALQDNTDISLALDESLPRYPLQTLLDDPPVKRLIIKPAALGGLLTAKRLVERARQAGLEAVVTSTLESSIGVLAAAQLAMAIETAGQPLAHGLATGDWFRTDVAEPLSIRRGRLRLPQTAGLGARLRSDFVYSNHVG